MKNWNNQWRYTEWWKVWFNIFWIVFITQFTKKLTTNFFWLYLLISVWRLRFLPFFLTFSFSRLINELKMFMLIKVTKKFDTSINKTDEYWEKKKKGGKKKDRDRQREMMWKKKETHHHLFRFKYNCWCNIICHSHWWTLLSQHSHC